MYRSTRDLVVHDSYLGGRIVVPFEEVENNAILGFGEGDGYKDHVAARHWSNDAVSYDTDQPSAPRPHRLDFEQESPHRQTDVAQCLRPPRPT